MEANWDALIERVEGASGPDRELDHAIAGIMGVPRGPCENVYYESRSIEYVDEQAPRYTASIDAACDLVAPGLTRSVTFDPTGGFASAGLASAMVLTDDEEQVWGDAQTPALALCAAALKARTQHGRS